MEKEELYRYVDHTALKAFTTWKDIEKLCEEAIKYHTASVCIPSCYISRVKETYGDKIKICTVVGFPLGYANTEGKLAETKKALEDGAEEIDMVINICDVKNGAYHKVEEEIRLLKEATGDKILKVIIETCYLTKEEKIAMCHAVTNAGADFIKTSTGFGTAGATMEDVLLMKEHIGAEVKIKAAGGIRTKEDMENYIKAKEDITKNQKVNDVCVLNYEDEVLRKFGESLSMKVLWFDSKKPVQNGCYLNGEKIIYVSEGKEEEVIDVNELNILGTHNYENVMAAVAMTISIGVPLDVIVKTLREFQAVEHRIEYVTEKRGVKFYNDSKGTNPDAAIKGIQAMNRPTLLIGGGYDKQSEYDEWIESFDGKVKKLALIGVTKEKIADCAKRHGFTDYVFADSLEEAVNICYDNAVSGDAVLLSPACASWDMFKSYEERGRIFKDLVRNLKE